MTRHLAVALTIVLVIVAFQRPAAQGTMSPERMYTVYVSGDYNVVARSLRTQSDYRAIRDDLFRLISEWKSQRMAASTTGPETPAWSPAPAGFVFEVAATVFPVEWNDAVRLLGVARDLVVSRPTGPLQNRPDAEDRFEVALYRAAVSLLCNFPGDANAYLDSISGRVSALGRLPGGEDLVARLVLARGMVAETATRPLATDATTPMTTGLATMTRGVGSGSSGSDARADRDRQMRLQHALLALGEAIRLPSIAAEANIRRGLVLHRLGDQSHALEALDRGLAASTDPVVSYWGALFRGRVLEASGRPADARASYEQAVALVPTAQTPAVALAALLLTQDDRAGAEQWAAAARAGRGGTSDPWWVYWLGDRRSWDEIVIQIRRPR